MDHGSHLRGACSCGRNHYLIILPVNPLHSFQVLYDDAAEHSKTLMALYPERNLTDGMRPGRGLSLRVPLTAIRSITQAYYPDETHNSIRRVFTPPHAPQTKRHFCGFCGTSLSYWSEESPEEANFVRVNIGSLKSESMDRLQEEGLLEPEENNQNEESQTGVAPRQVTARSPREVRGNPWFEEMIEGSDLGRIKRRRGGQTSSDGKTSVEWEIVEMADPEDSTGSGIGKRKLGEVGEDHNDVEMRA